MEISNLVLFLFHPYFARGFLLLFLWEHCKKNQTKTNQKKAVNFITVMYCKNYSKQL